MKDIRISVIVPAPHGIQACLYLEDWITELNGWAGEIIVADNSEQFDDRSDDILRHLRRPGLAMQGLLTEGVKSATGDWVILTEDHCRPLSGVIAEYLGHVESNPTADLVAGAVDNLTSRSPWSFVDFLIGLSEQWRESRIPPRTATNANMMIRRRAIVPDELVASGGLLNLTVPRLTRSNRMTRCPTAVVDHVVHLDRRTAIDFQVAVTYAALSEYRALAPPHGLCADIWGLAKLAIACTVMAPARVAKNTRGTSQSTLASRLRVAFACVAIARRLVIMDAKRILG